MLGLYAFGKIGEWLGRTMAAVSAVLDPDLFVIGGGVVAVGDILLEPARYNYQRFLEGSAYRGHAKIVAATAGQTPASSVPPTWLCADDAAPATGC